MKIITSQNYFRPSLDNLSKTTNFLHFSLENHFSMLYMVGSQTHERLTGRRNGAAIVG